MNDTWVIDVTMRTKNYGQYYKPADLFQCTSHPTLPTFVTT